MTFLATAFLWGAALAALPVVIHLVAGRKRETIRWGAMQFLMETERAKRRRLRRPAHLLLMLARMLAIAAVALAFAQPVVDWEVVRPDPTRDVVLVVDNSMSLDQETGGGPRSAELRRLASEVVGGLGRRDRVRLLSAVGPSDWIGGEAIRGGSEALGDRIRQMDYHPVSASWPEAILKGLRAKPAREGARREIVVITDGQAHGWRLADTAAWKGVGAESSETDVSVVTLADVDRPLWNLDIAPLAVEKPVVAAGDSVRVHATVRNLTAIPSEALSLQWYLEDEKLSLASVPEIRPGGAAGLTLEYQPEKSGCLVFRAVLDVADAILLDNNASAVVEVGRKIPILLVDGSGYHDSQRSDTRFVRAALAGGGDGTSTYEVEMADAERFQLDGLARYRAVILSNVGDLLPGQREAVGAYLRGHGGVLMAPGDQVDPDIFNVDFLGGGSDISPLSLSATEGDPRDDGRYERVAIADYKHPAMSGLAGFGQLDLPSARIYRRHLFDTSYDGDHAVLLEAGDGAAVAVAAGGEGGRVILLGVPLSLAWSNLPQLHFYVAMLHEWLWYLIEPGMAKRNLAAGEPIVETLAQEDTAAVWTLAPPAGDPARLAPRTVGGRRTGRYDDTGYPGVYWIDAGADVPPLGFSVARDPGESDLTPLDESQMAELAAMAGISFVGVGDLFAERAPEGAGAGRPFWQLALVALLVLMLVEAVITMAIQKRRRAPGDVAGAAPISS